VALFARAVRYEDRATDAIERAKSDWKNVEEIVLAIEWAILHDYQIGPLVNERGIRGFVYPGARSRDEPDIDVLYEDCDPHIVIHDLTFREAEANNAGSA